MYGKPNAQSGTYQVGVQISHRIYAQVQRKAIYGQLRKDIQEYIRTLCKYKGVEIIEGHMMLDHVHLLLRITPKISVSGFMGYLRGKSALMVFEHHANLKHKYASFVISPSAFRQIKSAQL